MAFVDKLSVAQNWILLGDARPVRAMTKLRFCDDPKCVAVTDGVFCGSQRRSDRDRRRHNDSGTYLKNVGIAKTGIQREQFLPAASVAEPRGRELPECVAGLDGDDD